MSRNSSTTDTAEYQYQANAARPLFFGEDAPDSGLFVDLDRLLKSRMLVQAASGGGKSYLARGLLEGTAGRVQQIVLDPEGEFATLRERFPFVLASAGDEGDVAARPANAAALCRSLMQLSASAVVDLSELKLAERRRFVRLFVEELMDLEREMWRPLLVMLDESHRYAPEKGAGEAESTDAVIALASQGRKRGFALAALTQRLSKLHKDVAAELLNVFVGFTQLDVDVGRAADALGFEKRRRHELRDLDHEFFAYGPALPAREPVRVRAGEILTTHPEPGGLSGGVGPAPPAPEELRSVLDELALSMSPSEDEPESSPASEGERGAREDAPTGADMERELQRRFDREFDKRVEARVAERLEAEVRKATDLLHGRINELEGAAEEGRRAAAELADSLSRTLAEKPDPTAPAPDAPAQTPQSRGEKGASKGRGAKRGGGKTSPAPSVEMETHKDAEAESTDGARTHYDRHLPEGLPPARAAVLSALYDLQALGVNSLPRANLAVFAEQGPRSSAFRDHVAALKEAGLVYYPASGQVSLTESGRERMESVAGGDARPRSLQELHAAWMRRLPDAGGRIVAALVESYPEALTREELARASSQSKRSSAFRDRVAELRTLGLAEYPASGRVRAGEMLFPEGLD